MAAKQAEQTEDLFSKASELRPLIGQRIDVTWGVGSQQDKHVSTGILTELTDTYLTLITNGTGGKAIDDYPVRIPYSFIIRWQQ